MQQTFDPMHRFAGIALSRGKHRGTAGTTLGDTMQDQACGTARARGSRG